MVLIMSIDIGKRNTAISVITVKNDFVFVQEIYVVEVRSNAINGVLLLRQTLLNLTSRFNFDNVVYEPQLSAVKGRSNANILANKFIEAYILGYFHDLDAGRLFGLQPKLRCKFISNHMDLTKYVFSNNKHRRNKQLSEYFVNNYLDIIYDNQASCQLILHCDKLDDIHDSIAQAVVSFERKDI